MIAAVARTSPVLRRLQKEGYLDVYDQEFAGRNRRYYRITPKGGVLLEESLEEWENFKSRSRGCAGQSPP